DGVIIKVIGRRLFVRGLRNDVADRVDRHNFRFGNDTPDGVRAFDGRPNECILKFRTAAFGVRRKEADFTAGPRKIGRLVDRSKIKGSVVIRSNAPRYGMAILREAFGHAVAKKIDVVWEPIMKEIEDNIDLVLSRVSNNVTDLGKLVAPSAIDEGPADAFAHGMNSRMPKALVVLGNIFIVLRRFDLVDPLPVPVISGGAFE